jgi:site-specific DNA recombinase
MTMTDNREPATKTALIYLRVSTAEQTHGAGSTEGYSIPAQRQACARKAAELGAEVVAEFADRGASARSADRPQLQAMLSHLAQQGGIDYVIVHKIDRLARNRADDVQIQLGIERAGAQLVSVSESVDKTPSGKLVRNIMADLAEFYSANLSTEILKGSTEKARRGGTPGLAPIGYLNVRQIVAGHEVRTVIVDQEKAPFVRRAFELYATEQYSIRQLHRRLTDEGFTTRATAKRPAQALALSKLHKLLRNRYYLGVITYRGIENLGLHEAIISAELFAHVQRILNERDQTSTKQRTHTHYLRGLLTCARCESRLIYMQVQGRRGGQFSYYACGRRHRLGTCTLPYLPAEDVERRLEQCWPIWVHLDRLDAEALAARLRSDIAANEEYDAATARRVESKLAKLDTERRKLLAMAYAEAIPLDLLLTCPRFPGHRF